MPGEQLVCILQAVRAVDGKKKADPLIPKPLLKEVIQKLQSRDALNLSMDTFNKAFADGEGTFAKLRSFVCDGIPSDDFCIKKIFDKVESACWELCKETYTTFLDTNLSEKLWNIANVLSDENTYPPRIGKEECEWLETKLGALLGSDWLSRKIAFPTSGLCFQEFSNALYFTYFGNLTNEEVTNSIDDLHKWLVVEVLQSGWIFKRSKKQANWTTWSKRWCVLTPSEMEYYDKTTSTKAAKLMGEIEIQNDTKVQSCKEMKGMTNEFKHRLKISDFPIVECELVTENEKLKNQWQNSLENVIKACKDKTTPVQKLLKQKVMKDEISKKADEELQAFFNRIWLSRPRKGFETRGDEGEGLEKASKNEEDAERSAEFLEEEAKKLKAVFMKIDTNGNGVLSREEFYQYVRDLGLKMNNKEIDLVFDTIDKDGNGHLSFDEFEEYFAQNILGENGTGESVASMRQAFLKADQDGSGTLTFKEFTEYMWDRKRSVRISQLLGIFEKLGKPGDKEISFSAFQDFLEKEGMPVSGTDAVDGGSNKNAFEKQLKCAFDETEVQELAESVQERWEAFAAFNRKGASGETVMTGSEEMVADFVPGEYSLIDLACFSDLPPLIPKHTVVKGIQWQSSTEKGKSGKIIFPKDFDGKIVTDFATNELLRYYGCSFADSRQEKISLLYRHGIQDFTYENAYLSDYVQKSNGGAGIEKHQFSHLDCPLDDESGFFVMAKITNDNEFHATAFKVPTRHTLYLPAGSIHSNDYLKGTWRTMLSDEAQIEHVHLTRRAKSDKLEKITFEFV
ncbi:hypothetical protein FSP39_016414 [Pinctada imbricata]|uniref:Calmodulin n=1 Tax=Pinctada imbricata TaxID=66713 RepID=A0AA89BM60_PINIB|nr:hypothetical protein FSP39_016414 [Pinctada imbricata]